MRNTHIQNLLSEVPKDLRLKVYKWALEYYEYPREEYIGLCLQLPKFLWDLKDYMDLAPDGSEWDFGDTGKAFPELTEDVIDSIICSYSYVSANMIRIENLTQWIEDLENN